MPIEIKPLPDIPDSLRVAAAAGKIVPFVGAGASRLAGCPGWSDFAGEMLKHLAKAGKLSYAELEHIRKLPARTQVSIAREVASASKVAIPYDSILPCDPSNPHKDGKRLYAAISRLGRRFLTTNVDRWLDYDFSDPVHTKRKAYYKSDDIDIEHFELDTVLHPHGSNADPEKMVLSTSEYLARYATGRDGGPENKLLTLMEHVFKEFAVVFIGYGLEEPEILEFLLLKHLRFRADPGKPELTAERRYVLLPFYGYESRLAEHLTVYWKDFNVEVIPFLRDERDHGQLIEVVEHFARELPPPAAQTSGELGSMRGMLDD